MNIIKHDAPKTTMLWYPWSVVEETTYRDVTWFKLGYKAATAIKFGLRLQVIQALNNVHLLKLTLSYYN